MLTKRFTPLLGRRSVAADTKSFPYFFSKIFLSATNSGISEHLGDANIKLAIPSFRSAGHSLNISKKHQNLYFIHDIQSQFSKLLSPSLCNDWKSRNNQLTEELNKLICSQNILLPYHMLNLPHTIKIETYSRVILIYNQATRNPRPWKTFDNTHVESHIGWITESM